MVLTYLKKTFDCVDIMTKLVEVKNISFSYDRDSPIVFENISFSIERGDVLCVLGPNGTGKTTLIKCINGLHKVNEGEVYLNGANIQSLSFKDISRMVGYIPQGHVPSFPFKVFDVVLMGRSPYINISSSPKERDREIAMNALETLGIEDLRDKSYTTLSGGERQLVFLARVLAQEPDLLILDEPTNHLDFGNQIHVLECIRGLSKTGLGVLMTTHNPDHAFLCDSKVALVQRDQPVIYGSAVDVIIERNMRDAYGVDVGVMEYISKKGERLRVCTPEV
mgnify:CR=1 FL=1